MDEVAIREWRKNPSQMVRDLFKAEPESWQEEALRSYSKVPRLSIECCRGAGLSCLLSWIAWNFLLTRLHAKIAATADYDYRLRDNLWSEMQKWQSRSPLLMQLFEIGSFPHIVNRTHPDSWWMSGRIWSRAADRVSNADTMAGVMGDNLLFLFDRAAIIPKEVATGAESALIGAWDAHAVQGGVPVSDLGMLYEAHSNDAWKKIKITSDPNDPNRCKRVAESHALEMIAMYGKDHPFVLANIFAEFPNFHPPGDRPLRSARD
jgi:phage terminase large subunit